MASRSSEASGADEAHIQRQVDAHSLKHQLVWMNRAVWLLPMDGLWLLLALQVGVPWGWVALWFAARAGMHVAARRLARRWLRWIDTDPLRGLTLTLRLYIAFGLCQAAMFPAIFFGTDDLPKLLAMMLAVSYTGSVVISAAGRQSTFWCTVGPAMCVMVAGWAMRGGWLGWIVVGMLCFSIPITMLSILQQRRSWEDLVRLRDEKERLAEALAAERDRAQSAADARTRFFAAASHDLRQPLHALSINATTLDLLTRRFEDARLTEISQGISRALAQSKGLLDALLDISRLDAGAVSLHLTETNLVDLLKGLCGEFEGVAAQRRLDFSFDAPSRAVWVRTDADQLLRILRNLLDNAFKFTDQGGVSLALRLVREDGQDEEVRIAVADTGCGIAAANRERVFEEFYQVGNPTRDRSRGLGLGLAIVRRTAAMLGARIVLGEGEQGRGAVFELVLGDSVDVDVEPLPPTQAPAAVDEPGARLSVLLVDDESDIVQALSGLLTAKGWAVHLADSMESALKVVSDETAVVDAAVVDYRLPGANGIELVQGLRECRPMLPALIVTGDVAVHWQVRRHALRVLHKPLDGETLANAVLEEAAAAAGWSARHESFQRQMGGSNMNLIDAIHGRRSVRNFSAETVAPDQIEDLIWHASQVPRPPGSDDSTWAFHVIAGRERLADFGARAKRYAAEHQAPGEARAWAERGDFEVFWGAPLAVLICARRRHPEAPMDCCRAGQNLALLAHAAGLGSCWLGSCLPWLGSAEGREAARLPLGYDVAVALAIGHPAAVIPGRTTPRPAVTWCA